ncbi:[protein-PII] uridylyltransferase [Terriglobus roseus]|uniref:Bifunctional uridylyltransferase/uridylyl-removing enzyme n=1 Tax=Terriglobus roseus TaxID=392734 RepID=A0A1H4TB93_9BACT|nr:[protein-PII] uridylyltransferase [Terriglobus roseus]SEC53530.1 UTP--GlnB (protein PII) uridylyltransferase, GlnD [Terriglobus roseus]
MADDTAAPRQQYLHSMATLRGQFSARATTGVALVHARAAAADALVRALWQAAEATEERLQSGIAVLAVGGYGRQELFPASDLDLLFIVEDAAKEKSAKDPIKRINQQLWDSEIRVAATTRVLSECEKYDSDNAEFTLSLLDARQVAGDVALSRKLTDECVPKLLDRERKGLIQRVAELTRERHARYGNTLFHLEPNIKECPGGLRDAHVCGWLARLTKDEPSPMTEFREAFDFLAAVRCFLHLRNGRDSNALDWKTQDAAAADGIGVPSGLPRDAAHWMQLYFRHARVIARRLEQQIDALPKQKSLLKISRDLLKRSVPPETPGMRLERGRIMVDDASGTYDPACDPEVMLLAFQTIAETGAPLSNVAEVRLEEAVPVLSSQLEEGTALWHKLRLILLGRYAGQALRSMHALGILELLIPEFHGIDALVIRDAYHRYTVDEHTFVLIDTLHGLFTPGEGPMAEWKRRFAAILRDLQHADLLYLASLLHDTGKGRSTGEHTTESARLAKSVVARLELDDYEAGLVLGLIQNHLEMSAALRRDIFDAETIRGFAAKIQTPEELRMITLFTFADIHAVHPDALTPWKAENLWRLYIATSNHLDRNIDEERVDLRVSSELVLRVAQLLQGESRDVMHFLEGFPQRYLRTRSPEQIRTHYLMSKKLSIDAVQLDFVWRADRSEITLVTPDRQLLFARIAGVLAAWGMNIITADAFSNAHGIVVDSFRFTDSFKTLEMNPSERERLVQNLHDAIADPAVAEKMIANRKRSRRRAPLVDVQTSVEFDTESSSHSTVLQVVAQDLPGLLYAISTTIGEARANIEVAVIDTEGDTAIDVFYLTRDGDVLESAELPELQAKLVTAIATNAG